MPLLFFTFSAIALFFAWLLYREIERQHQSYIAPRFTQARTAKIEFLKSYPTISHPSTPSAPQRETPNPPPATIKHPQPQPESDTAEYIVEWVDMGPQLGTAIKRSDPRNASKPKLEIANNNQALDYSTIARFINWDRDAAKRIVKQLMDANPDKSEQWCYEKALIDLERDRR
ncbi:MAG: hypothetical protein KME20_05175 [Kaiparowitsia implicata GSE-PSE-MK54-09C]|jgi:hypothetical protein|nr:hypothetical protein [Kaiparowitsia implicata GSE-PSE-MK54-09C]